MKKADLVLSIAGGLALGSVINILISAAMRSLAPMVVGLIAALGSAVLVVIYRRLEREL